MSICVFGRSTKIVARFDSTFLKTSSGPQSSAAYDSYTSKCWWKTASIIDTSHRTQRNELNSFKYAIHLKWIVLLFNNTKLFDVVRRSMIFNVNKIYIQIILTSGLSDLVIIRELLYKFREIVLQFNSVLEDYKIPPIATFNESI
jgi:hypothetical protein